MFSAITKESEEESSWEQRTTISSSLSEETKVNPKRLLILMLNTQSWLNQELLQKQEKQFKLLFLSNLLFMCTFGSID